MKTYLPQIERRIVVRRNPVFGIINYDIDNAYPQRVLELVRQSPTAKSCWGKRSKYIGGNGFEAKDLGKVVVNAKKGLTLAKLLKSIAKDKGLFPGWGLHVNWNANFKITDVTFVKYEDIRQGDTDAADFNGKYVVYRDWGRKTWRSIYTGKFDILDPFNPDPAVITAQVIAAGGWDNYKGQLFYLTPVIDDYDLCEFDAALEDIQTEAGIKIFNNRQVETGFMPSAMVFMKARKEEADNEGPQDDETTGGVGNYLNNGAGQPSQLELNLANFQGAANAQKVIVIEWEGSSAEDKPDFHQYTMQNNDKQFEVTSGSVEGNIIKAFNVPKELVSSDSKNGLSNGGEKLQAIREFNDTTAPERNEVSETLAMIFSYFAEPVNPEGNWNITEVTTEGASPDVVKYADKTQAIIESSKLSRDNKISILVNIYGFRVKEAESMVPQDAFIAAAVAAGIPATKPAPAADDTPAEPDNKINEEDN